MIGVPIGIVAGRWAWQLIADHVGVVSAPAIPALAIVLTVVGLWALANLVAAIPGRRAARVDVAEALRAD